MKCSLFLLMNLAGMSQFVPNTWSVKWYCNFKLTATGMSLCHCLKHFYMCHLCHCIQSCFMFKVVFVYIWFIANNRTSDRASFYLYLICMFNEMQTFSYQISTHFFPCVHALCYKKKMVLCLVKEYKRVNVRKWLRSLKFSGMQI